MDPTPWIEFLKLAFNYGVPTGLAVLLLFGIGFACWRIGRFVAKIVQDLVETGKPVASAHVAYLKESTETMAHIRQSLGVSSERHDRTHVALEHVAEAVHAAAPDERRAEVRPHVDAVKSTLR